MSTNMQATTIGPAPVRGGGVRWLIVVAAIVFGMVGGLVLGQAIGLGSSGVAPVRAPAVGQVRGQNAPLVPSVPAERPATGRVGSVGSIPSIGWSGQCSMGRVLIRC